MDNYDEEGWVNIGTSSDLKIKDLAKLVAEVVGTKELSNGTPLNLMVRLERLNVGLVNSLGWKASIDLRKGLESVYDNYLEEQ